MDLIDVDRVEVLRGPQGTLFGRNAVGGAVSVHSRRPDAEARRSIRAQVGDDRMTNLTASANGALGDGLFGSVTLALRKRDGYVTRSHDGLDKGNDNGRAARGAIVWRPSSTFEVFATADYSRKRENGAPTVNGGVNDKQAFGRRQRSAARLHRDCRQPQLSRNGPPTFPPPGQGAGGAEGCYGPDSFAGEYVSEGTFPAFSDLDSWGAGARVSWSLGGGVTLRSLTGYRGLDMWSSGRGQHARQRPADPGRGRIRAAQPGIAVERFRPRRPHTLADRRLPRPRNGVLSGRRDAPDRGLRQPLGPGQLVDGGFAQATADVTGAASLTVGARTRGIGSP